MSELLLPPPSAELPYAPAENQAAATNEWRRLTGGILREIDNPDVQNALMKFSTMPVAQTMAGDMLRQLPDTPLLTRLQESAVSLPAYADAPVVEEERIVPDLQHAWKAGRITTEEFGAVDQRYTMARDVKLLALGAELHHVQTGDAASQADTDDTITLPSGVTLHGVSAAAEEPALLDPSRWESRDKLKDRVYVVTAGDKKYIMKEQKTARHIDTTEKGHRESHSVAAAHEFAVGNRLNAETPDYQDGISVKWEQPLGYVTYPDGYEFGTYAYEPDLIGPGVALGELYDAITTNPELFAEEFAAASADISRFTHTEVVRHARDVTNRSLGQRALQAIGITPRHLKQQLTFDEFAVAKAQQMMITANQRQAETHLQLGLIDYDDDGTLYRVDKQQGTLDIIGMDYERYAAITPKKQREKLSALPGVMAARHQDRLQDRGDTGIPDEFTGRERAALLALLEKSDTRWASDNTRSV